MKKGPFIHLFETPFGYYFYDVNKNTQLKISEESYRYLSESSNHECDSTTVPEEINALRSKGYLSTQRPRRIEHPMTNRLEHELSNNVHQMTLQVTKQCNFRCAYCVYGDVAFDAQRKHKADFMDFETAKRALDFLAVYSKDQEDVVIGFYGGEPLLAFPLIKKAIQYTKEIFGDKKVSFTTTTNASLLTPNIAKFLFDHDCSIMLSLDGPSEVQNESRRYAATGQGSYNVVMDNIRRIVEQMPDSISKLSVNTVVDPRNDYGDITRFFDTQEVFTKMNCRRTLVDDAYFIEKSLPTNDYTIPKEKQLFFALLNKFGLYSGGQLSAASMQDLKSMFESFAKDMGKTTSLPDVIAPGGPCVPGQRRVFVTTSGDLYPCERVSETSDAMKIGHIDSGFDLEKASRVLNIGKLTEDECRECWAIRHCQLCAKHCDKDGTLSGEVKKTFCNGIKTDTDQKMRLSILVYEMENRYGRKQTG
jgi:CLI_3235-class bacteriocin maturation radical SAM enzyme